MLNVHVMMLVSSPGRRRDSAPRPCYLISCKTNAYFLQFCPQPCNDDDEENDNDKLQFFKHCKG